MLATTATASLAATPGNTSKTFLAALWKTPIPAGEQRYYDGMLYMMSMLHCSGNFRNLGSKMKRDDNPSRSFILTQGELA